MGEQGAALQKYNQELVKCIESIKLKRNEVVRDIEKEERTKSDLEAALIDIKAKLDEVNISLARKYELTQSYDAAVKESEVAYMKILEISEVLLSKVRRESELLDNGAPS